MQNQQYYYSYQSAMPPYQPVPQQIQSYYQISPTASQIPPRVYYQEIPTIDPSAFQFYPPPVLYETVIPADKPSGYYIPQATFSSIYPNISIAPPIQHTSSNYPEPYYLCDINSNQQHYAYPVSNYIPESIILQPLVVAKNGSKPIQITQPENDKSMKTNDISVMPPIDDDFSTLYNAAGIFAKGISNNKNENKETKKIKIKKPKNVQTKERSEGKLSCDLMRKKNKRYLIVNQKADAELAEISAEQDALKNRSSHLIKNILNASILPPSNCDNLESDRPNLSPRLEFSHQKDLLQHPDSSQLHNFSHSLDLSLKADSSRLLNLSNHQNLLHHSNLLKANEIKNGYNDCSELDINELNVVEQCCDDRDKVDRLDKLSLGEAVNKEFSKLVNKELHFIEETAVDLINESKSNAIEQSAANPTQNPAQHNSLDYTLSPLSQLSPYYLSPTSNDYEIIGQNHDDTTRSGIAAKIHSRRFREYCNQVLDKSIDDCCTELLQDLVRLQDKFYHEDSKKVKQRMFVLGLREVTKHLRLGKLVCVIISPNLEQTQNKNCLDETLNTIIEMCTKQGVPFVFALGRRALGRACAKLVPVSVVGIFSCEGSENQFNKLKDLTEKAREEYAKMVTTLNAEISNISSAIHMETETSGKPSLGSLEKLFPHLTHSRTPSACSAISFLSSVISEPVSTNLDSYLQSDMDMDMKPRKIPDLDTVGEDQDAEEDQHPSNHTPHPRSPHTHSKSSHPSPRAPTSNQNRDDMGNEADTEEDDKVGGVKIADDPAQHRLLKQVGDTPQTANGLIIHDSKSKRIESWVAETQKVIESLRFNDDI